MKVHITVNVTCTYSNYHHSVSEIILGSMMHLDSSILLIHLYVVAIYHSCIIIPVVSSETKLMTLLTCLRAARTVCKDFKFEEKYSVILVTAMHHGDEQVCLCVLFACIISCVWTLYTSGCIYLL